MLDQKYTTFMDLIRECHPEDLSRIALCMKLLSTTKAIDRACAEKLNGFQLSESRLLVLTLLDGKGALTPLEIAEFCGVTKASMTQQINTLFNDQLIEKRAVEGDKRKYLVALTAKGQGIIMQALAEHTTWIQCITDSLSQVEMAQLNTLLDKITQNVCNIKEKL